MIHLNRLLIALLLVCLPAQIYASEMENMDYVRLRALDKIIARMITFEAQVGKTVTFGNIFIKVQACRQAPAVEEPESAAFLQIWEGDDDANTEWIFSGWMFASSPGISHMDHPVYDVWVLECMASPTLSKIESSDSTSDSEEEGEITPEPDPSVSIDTPEPDPMASSSQ